MCSADDTPSLGTLFHTFICIKVLNYRKNYHSRQQCNGKSPGSDSLQECEDSDGFEDNSAYHGATWDDDDIIYDEPSGSRNYDSTPRSTVRKTIPPNAAPVAPMLPTRPSMDNIPAQLDADDPTTAHTSRHQHHHTMPSDYHNDYQGSVSLNSGKFGLEANANEPTDSPARGLSETPSNLHGPNDRDKRAVMEDTTLEPTAKRSKLSTGVFLPKPSLVVILKLTRAQGAFKRAKTAPPQQPQVPPQSSASEDILVRPPQMHVPQYGIDADDDDRRQQEHFQPDMQEQDIAGTASGTTGKTPDVLNDSVPGGTSGSRNFAESQFLGGLPSMNPSRHAVGGVSGSAVAKGSPTMENTAPPDLPSDTNGASTNIEIYLYIDGKANPDPAESDSWLMLTDMTDRDKLFSMTMDDLQVSSHLDADDEIVAIRFEHADGIIPGTDKKVVWIKRFGQQDMWKYLLRDMSEAKSWNDSRSGLRGYVKVRKNNDAK